MKNSNFPSINNLGENAEKLIKKSSKSLAGMGKSSTFALAK